MPFSEKDIQKEKFKSDKQSKYLDFTKKIQNGNSTQRNTINYEQTNPEYDPLFKQLPKENEK
ncbi:hypothetical protein NOQ67_002701 [Enterococcus faecalis]|uniref:hypothetical protein n=1 Tax=Enterococcus faecalis TaxID=1351 RepID=UPI0013D4DF19|nr:hypothetical protein [Enterococcus faecalis]EJM6036386.1 hypothetical protein [Enterococcus faecalis]NFA63733.1 hypothetical protein [Enterococcus faecalis]HAP3019608.1 hypothetical protein [Enterococcus faecalis]